MVEEACNTIWNGAGWPKAWKTGIIVPLKKKGDGKKTEDYGGDIVEHDV